MKELLLKLVNALEGGYGWIAEVAAILILVITINIILKWLLVKLRSNFKKKEEIWKEGIITALIPPLTSIVWLIAASRGVNFIYQRLTNEPLVVTSHAIIKTGFLLALGWFALRCKKEFFKILNSQGKPDRKMDALNKVFTLLIFFVTSFLLLEQTGSSVNILLAFGGISGLAIAFASQQIITNFFGGLMIYFTHPFDVGDWIQLPEKNIEGIVEEIGWYTTEVRTFDKRPIYVPNSMLTNTLVTNPSRMTHRRFKESIELRFQDLPLLPAIIQDLEAFFFSYPAIDQSIKPLIHFEAIGTHSVNINITAYTSSTNGYDYANIAQELLFGIIKIVAKHGADFASPVTAIEFAKGTPFVVNETV